MLLHCCNIIIHNLATQQSKQVESPYKLVNVDKLIADFTTLLLTVCEILNDCPNHQDKLQKCKDYCSLLPMSDGSNELLFKAEKINEIKKSTNFKELFENIRLNMSWDEHSILTHIVHLCNSTEGQKEIEKFWKKMAVLQGLEIIFNIPKHKPSEEFIKFCIIIDKPYQSLTIEEYMNIKTYIFSILDIRDYVTFGFIKMLYSSLHIEWLVTIQAVPYMIKSACQNKNIFIKEKFVFMQIGTEVVINDQVSIVAI